MDQIDEMIRIPDRQHSHLTQDQLDFVFKVVLKHSPLNLLSATPMQPDALTILDYIKLISTEKPT